MANLEQKTWLQKYWWTLLIAGIIIIVAVPLLFMGIISPVSMSKTQGLNYGEAAYDSVSSAGGYGSMPRLSMQDFAPEVEERQLIKTSSASLEIERGQFYEAQDKVKNILTASGAFILSENFRSIGEGSYTYKTNTFQLKIETSKYDAVVEQLKDVAEITSFQQTATDVTGAITNAGLEIEVEKARLKRYEDLMNRQARLEDQITLTDRIFEQERRIIYLEDNLKESTQQVAYSTISLTLTEKKPALYGVAFAGWNALIKTFVGSINALLYFISAVLPWIVGAGILYWIYRLIRKRA